MAVMGEEREEEKMITEFWLKQFHMVVILIEIRMTRIRWPQGEKKLGIGCLFTWKLNKP